MTDLELLDLLRGGDSRGLEGLLERYGPLIRYVIRGILPDAGQREECYSDISLRLWEQGGRYDPARGSVRAWLATMARNAALNRVRGTHGDWQALEHTMADPAPGPEDQVLARERAARIQAAVKRLSGLDQSLFYRKYCYFQTAEQMAAELGLTRRAVESRLYRLKKRLQRELGGEKDG